MVLAHSLRQMAFNLVSFNTCVDFSMVDECILLKSGIFCGIALTYDSFSLFNISKNLT